MIVNIHLPPSLEATLQRRALEAGLDLATYVQQLITEEVGQEDSEVNSKIEHEEFERRLHDWVNLHPVHEHLADDDRDSIYSGRA